VFPPPGTPPLNPPSEPPIDNARISELQVEPKQPACPPPNLFFSNVPPPKRRTFASSLQSVFPPTRVARFYLLGRFVWTPVLLVFSPAIDSPSSLVWLSERSIFPLRNQASICTPFPLFFFLAPHLELWMDMACDGLLEPRGGLGFPVEAPHHCLLSGFFFLSQTPLFSFDSCVSFVWRGVWSLHTRIKVGLFLPLWRSGLPAPLSPISKLYFHSLQPRPRTSTMPPSAIEGFP